MRSVDDNTLRKKLAPIVATAKQRAGDGPVTKTCNTRLKCRPISNDPNTQTAPIYSNGESGWHVQRDEYVSSTPSSSRLSVCPLSVKTGMALSVSAPQRINKPLAILSHSSWPMPELSQSLCAMQSNVVTDNTAITDADVQTCQTINIWFRGGRFSNFKNDSYRQVLNRHAFGFLKYRLVKLTEY
jgi:hypothetical protein